MTDNQANRQREGKQPPTVHGGGNARILLLRVSRVRIERETE